MIFKHADYCPIELANRGIWQSTSRPWCTCNTPDGEINYTDPPPQDGGVVMRQFKTGANRNSDDGKLDYEGFFSPLVLDRLAQYMHKHRYLEDGTLRDSDNWQKGIPQDAYMKSGWRHFMDWWKEHRGLPSREGLEDALCGLIFNAMGYLFELLKKKID